MSTSPAVLDAIRRCQTVIAAQLKDGERTHAELFTACGLDDRVRIAGLSPDRILDRALQGMRRVGEIRYDRKLGAWTLVKGPADAPSL